MVCRTLRNLLVGRLAISGLACLALIAAASAPPRLSFADDEPTTIGLRAPEVPLAALQTTSAFRYEKHATSVRLTLHKPERNAHVSWAARTQTNCQRPVASHASPGLARRFLPPRHFVSVVPDRPGDPFLARSSRS